MPSRFKLSPYWTCQLLGWGTVAPYWLYYELKNKSLAEGLFVVSIQVALQIFVTNQYRLLTHRRGWLRQPLLKQLPRILLAWLIFIGVYMLMVYGTFSVQFDGDFWADNVWLGALAGGTRYHAIWLLAFHLYHFAHQMADQRAAAARNAQLAAEAQLAKLSNELNPHFLFNALNGIKALTRESPVNARLAIDRLAELLRYSLRQSEQSLVTFSEEKRIIEEYVALEKMRLEERLTLNWILPDLLPEFPMPPLSLHTLVENAVKHGISRLSAGGQITIKLSRSDRYWVFTVTNNGHYAPGNPGSGLANLRQRLQLQYSGTADLTIGNEKQATDPTVVATLSLPL